MRYYNIIITDPATGNPIKRNYDGTPFQWTSRINDQPVPSAPLVEFDIPVAAFATPISGAWVRIWGIDIRDISQASSLSFKTMTVYGGMQKGLPLAIPQQQGLLAQGTIQAAYGNWEDTNQTLDINFTAASAAGDAPQNLILNWNAGTPLSVAIANTLATAFPSYKANISISPNIVLANDEPGFYGNLTQFAQYVKAISLKVIQSIGYPGYHGVDIAIKEGVFSVFDGTSPTNPIQINFNDLIGQATWINAGQIQFYCVMRGDLTVGEYIKMPPGQVTITAESYPQYKDQSVFQGIFLIASLRHVGNSRAGDGRSWVTVVTCSVVTQPNGG